MCTLELDGPGDTDVITDATLAAWVDEYSPRLYHAAVRLSSEAAAPDLCQEVFLVAARRRDGFDGRSAPYTWLYGILRNLARDASKKRARWARLRLEAPADQLNPERRLDKQQRQAEVRQAVAQLPAQQRGVVERFYLQDQPVTQVAEELGIAVGTVKSRLFKARGVLRRALKGDR